MFGLQKLSTIILYILAAVSVVIAGLFYLGGTVPETIGTVFEEPTYTQAILTWAAILFVIAAVLTVLFSFLGVFTSTHGLRNAAIIIVAAVVLIGVSYALSSDAPIAGREETATTLKWVDTGLFSAYILAGLAFVGIIASEISRAFK